MWRVRLTFAACQRLRPSRSTWQSVRWVGVQNPLWRERQEAIARSKSPVEMTSYVYVPVGSSVVNYIIFLSSSTKRSKDVQMWFWWEVTTERFNLNLSVLFSRGWGWDSSSGCYIDITVWNLLHVVEYGIWSMYMFVFGFFEICIWLYLYVFIYKYWTYDSIDVFTYDRHCIIHQPFIFEF